MLSQVQGADLFRQWFLVRGDQWFLSAPMQPLAVVPVAGILLLIQRLAMLFLQLFYCVRRFLCRLLVRHFLHRVFGCIFSCGIEGI